MPLTLESCVEAFDSNLSQVEGRLNRGDSFMAFVLFGVAKAYYDWMSEMDGYPDLRESVRFRHLRSYQGAKERLARVFQELTDDAALWRSTRRTQEPEVRCVDADETTRAATEVSDLQRLAYESAVSAVGTEREIYRDDQRS